MKYIPKNQSRNIIHDALFGDNLTLAVEALIVAFDLTEAQHRALGDLIAEVLGRATSLTASINVKLIERVSALEAPDDATRRQTHGR